MTKRVVVIGGGTMGAGIAYVFAQSGDNVEAVDPMAAGRATCRETVERVASRAVEQGRLTSEESQAVMSRVSIHDDLSKVSPGPDLVVEAVPEDRDVKIRVLQDAEKCNPRILATNTSSISINVLASALSRKECFLGMHFFNPVWSNPLLEIVTGDATDDQTLTATLAIAEGIGKEAIVVQDSPGFASSRLGVALGLEAIRMLEDGVASAEDIDRAMEVGYRHPMGPLRLTDLVGLDVRLGIARNLEQEFGSRFAPPRLLVEKVAKGELGKKSGQGFFNW